MEEENDPGEESGRVGSLQATYITERYEYPVSKAIRKDNNEQKTMSIRVYSATTTLGGNLVSDNRDLTGIMVWPATHLLCFHLASHKVGDHVLELGCGVGVVGLVSSKANLHKLWVSTDGDESSLAICRRNFQLNQLACDGGSAENIWIRQLEWGVEDQIRKLSDDLKAFTTGIQSHFDAIVAADIVYPATCGLILKALFDTVDQLLKPGGVFWLSFVSRDGAKTPRQLIESAAAAGFRIDALPPLTPTEKAKLPPLLDARILKLTKDTLAVKYNVSLGADDCHVFPGLKAAIARLDEPSSEEEWDAPFGVDDDDNDYDDDSSAKDGQ